MTQQTPPPCTVTARCTPEGSFSLAVSRDAVVPPVRLDSLHLLGRRGGPCGPLLRNEAFVVFNFPLSACGTIFKVSGEGVTQQQPCEVGGAWQRLAGWGSPSLLPGLKEAGPRGSHGFSTTAGPRFLFER